MKLKSFQIECPKCHRRYKVLTTYDIPKSCPNCTLLQINEAVPILEQVIEQYGWVQVKEITDVEEPINSATS